MKPGLPSIISLFAGCLAAFLTWIPAADAALQNGGITVLHSTYQLCPDGPLDTTLVVVAADQELSELMRKFRGGTEDVYIALDSEAGTGATFAARLQWVDRDELIGQTLADGHPVRVVSRTYAKRRHWLPAGY